MQTQYFLVLLPPLLALLITWVGARSVSKGAAEIDTTRAEMNRKRQSPAE